MTEDLFLGQSPHVNLDWLSEDNDYAPLREGSQRAYLLGDNSCVGVALRRSADSFTGWPFQRRGSGVPLP